MLEHYFEPHGPGAVMAVVRAGARPWIECQGLADLASGRPLDPDTRFELASVSKWFTAAALMRLVERGLLDIDDPVAELLPTMAPDRADGQRTLRVRDLLWHCSGLPDYLELGHAAPAESLSDAWLRKQAPGWLAEARPGVEHLYCNTNYVMLGWIIEAVAGRPFAEVVQRELLNPAGLPRSCVGPSPDDVARGYRNLGFGLPAFEAVPEIDSDTLGDGGVCSTLNDLLRWCEAFFSGDLLRPASVQLMCAMGHTDDGQTFPYGLGLQVEGGGEWCGHAGSWTRSTTLAGRLLSHGSTIIVLSNEWMAPVERIAQRALGGRQAGAQSGLQP